MALEIINPGFLTLLQDYGRYGLQKFGITHGGPMDEHAFLWGNRLLGNDFNAVQLEICLGGFSVRFHKSTIVALCGAQAQVSLNNQKINMWQTHCVEPGDEIRVDVFSSGLYAYLAIKQGFDVGVQLNSVATVMREKLGGLHQDGQKLVNKENIDYRQHVNEYRGVAEFKTVVPARFLPSYQDEVILRFIPNRSESGCSDQTIDDFVNQSFEVSADINRMGYRLQGDAISSEKKGIISQGISVGTIQLPPAGQPIILMKDRQTVGGYPQLGCLVYQDIGLLSQCRPGAKVTFQAVELSEVEQEFIAYLQFFGVKL